MMNLSYNETLHVHRLLKEHFHDGGLDGGMRWHA